MNRPREALTEQEVSSQSSNQAETLGTSQAIVSPTSPMTSAIDQEHLWFQRELERSQELSEHIAEALSELRELRALLSQRYRPDLEGQVQRLSIERDETLISWGQSLLGLCDSGASLLLERPTGERLKLYPIDEFPKTKHEIEHSSEQHEHSLKQEFNVPIDLDQDGARVFGHSDTPLPSQALDDQNSSVTSVGAKHQLSGETDRSEGDQDDPGVADAPKVSLTQFSLDDLREQMLSPKGWSDDSDVNEDKEDENVLELATELSYRLGRPRELSTGQLKEHLIELEAEVECCQSWSVFDQEIQHAVVTLVTSRLRAIQDYIGESPFDQDRIAKMFRRLTRFSSDFRPGFIHGLSREKIPEHDSWRSDERHAWSRLEGLLNIKPTLPSLSSERAAQLSHLRDLLAREDELTDFSNVLRAAVTECLNSGFTQESPHLVKALSEHLSHLSGKRFKKLRLAASNSRF